MFIQEGVVFCQGDWDLNGVHQRSIFLFSSLYVDLFIYLTKEFNKVLMSLIMRKALISQRSKKRAFVASGLLLLKGIPKINFGGCYLRNPNQMVIGGIIETIEGT